MSLAQIEALCNAAKVECRREDGGLVVTINGEYENLFYPVLISERKDGGGLQALAWFPPAESSSIENVEALCTDLTEIFSPDAQVGYNRELNKFWAGCLLKESGIPKHLEAFTCVCDIMYPLVARVGSLGRWDESLIDLACIGPEDMPGHA